MAQSDMIKAGGVLNVHRRFAIPAFTPVLLNLAIVAAALFLAPHVDPPIMALGWGVFVGGVAQLALQIVPLAKLRMLPCPRFDWRDAGVRRVLAAMAPAILGVSAAQIAVSRAFSGPKCRMQVMIPRRVMPISRSA